MRKILFFWLLVSCQMVFADFDSECRGFYAKFHARNTQPIPTDENIFIHLDRIFKPERPTFLRWRTLGAAEKCRHVKTWLKKTENLDFSGSNEHQITSIDILSKAKALKVLNLRGHHVQDVKPLHRLINLSELFLIGNDLTEEAISDLRSFPFLKTLDISNNQAIGPDLEDISPNLTVLIARNCGFIRLSKGLFGKMTKLERLDLADNQIESFFFSPLEREITIDLSGNPISREPLSHPLNKIIVSPSVPKRLELQGDEKSHPDNFLERLGAEGVINLKYVTDIAIFACHYAKNLEFDQLDRLFIRFSTGESSRFFFAARNDSTKDAMAMLIEKYIQGDRAERARILMMLEVIAINSNMEEIIAADTRLFATAAKVPVLSLVSFFLSYVKDKTLLRKMSDLDVDPKAKDLIQKSLRDEDFTTDESLLEQQREEVENFELTMASAPGLNNDNQTTPALFSQLHRGLIATRQRLHSTERRLSYTRQLAMLGQLQVQELREHLVLVSAIGLSPKDLEKMKAGDGRQFRFYQELQGRIIDYFHVASLIATGDIKMNYKSSTATVAASLTEKVLNKIGGQIAGALSLPAYAAAYYLDQRDQDRAGKRFEERSRFGRGNLLEFMKIGHAYSFNITQKMADRKLIPAGDVSEVVSLAMRFFEAYRIVAALKKGAWSDSTIEDRITDEVANAVAIHQQGGNWRDHFKKRAQSLLSEVNEHFDKVVETIMLFIPEKS